MPLFDHMDFDAHEQVIFCADADAGLRAIIAIHDTTLGPALGGCRMWPYASDAEALTDALRLSRGMTYKSAMAGLPLGGGKSVIIGNPRTGKSEALLRAMGRSVERAGGRYIVAEDSGTSVADMKVMAQETAHVSGIHDKATGDGGQRSGDPSPATAYGVFTGLKAAVRHRLGRTDLDGLTVAVQGVGNVGGHLARLLKDAGARLILADIDTPRVTVLARELGAEVTTVEGIFDAAADVFAPCALGSVLNDDTIPRLRCAVVAGAANNQLGRPHHGEEIRRRGILYAPDYVINAGGIIDIHHERTGYNPEKAIRHIEAIGPTLAEIFARADTEGQPTGAIADAMARERIGKRR
ncbi:leucine dehydrogenase [Azospirillum fermentarium]|uniref:Glu/Leu/Phe/Val dehydrogenase dimerization domain-containing protein n=1 Tax=Azospirillum fermentarium TaxID=1233114 RepID=UPI0022268C31|nr:Glu/Leu/Phe/Val dehydrogenase dimerization domain-containing protein [Azospirillum fermentarium]MCW2249108.1 leucine dehydrogenase [Azospirillum fermentarium]